MMDRIDWVVPHRMKSFREGKSPLPSFTDFGRVGSMANSRNSAAICVAVGWNVSVSNSLASCSNR